MAAHPKRLSEKHDWTTAAPGDIGSDFGCRINIEDVVAVA
jgi:hypothetical protein